MRQSLVVLAGLLRNPWWWGRARGVVASCFEDEGERALFRVMDSHRGRMVSVDVVEDQVSKLAGEPGRVLPRVLGEALAVGEPSVGDWGYAVDWLLREARTRAVEEGLKEAASELLDGGLHGAERRVRRLVRDLDARTSDGAAQVQDARAEIEKVFSAGFRGPIMRTGIKQLDDITGGCSYGQLWLWGGYTFEAKSSFAAFVASNLVTQGRNVFYATLEMTEREMDCLLLTHHSHKVVGADESGMTGLPYGCFSWLDAEHEELLKSRRKDVLATVRDFRENEGYGWLRIWHPAFGARMRDLVERLAAVEAEAGSLADAVFVDYFGMLDPSSPRMNTREGLNEILVDAKRLAMMHHGGRGVLVFSPWQISSDGYDRALKEAKYTMRAFSETIFAARRPDVMGWNLFTEEGRQSGSLKQGVLKNRTTGKVCAEGYWVRVNLERRMFADDEHPEVGGGEILA